MTSSQTSKPSYSRRIKWLAAFVVVLFGGYSAGWFYVSNRLQDQVKVALAEAEAISFRTPYQGNATLRKQINSGQVKFFDMHLSTVPQSASGRPVWWR